MSARDVTVAALRRLPLAVCLAVALAGATCGDGVERAVAGPEGRAGSSTRTPATRGGSVPPTLVCPIQRGSGTLPPESLRGLIQHLSVYPAVELATRGQRRAAEELLRRIRAAAVSQRWGDAARAARDGFVRRTVPRRAGDTTVHYLHAERLRERRGGPLLDPARPKALIYANAPNRPLALVGVMYSLRRGQRGPSPGGPITRWHSHLVCASGRERGTKPPEDVVCPRGTRLRQGSEMMHVWFTGDLRSAFAVSAPEPELCRGGLLPGGYCSRLDGGRHGM